MTTGTVSCPKCQSGSVSVNVTRMDRKSGKPLGKGKLIWGFILLFCGVVWAIIPIMMASSKNGLDASAFIALGMAGLAIFFAIRILKGYYGSSQIRESECLNCRYRWTQWSENVGVKTAGSFCPQCGKEEVFTSVYKANKDTQKPVSAFMGWVGLPAGILIAVGAIAMAISVWSEGDDGFIQWQYGSTIAGIGFLLIGYWLSSILIVPGIQYFRATERRDHRCGACGHTWAEWADGTPIETAQTLLDKLKGTEPGSEPPAEGSS